MPYRTKQKQIMRVVEKLAANHRFYEITMDEVAETAKVGKGTIYRYFENKDELFFQVATSGFDELCELLQKTAPCHHSFSDKLLNVCEQITVFYEKRRPLLEMMQNEANFAGRQKENIRQYWFDKRRMLVEILAEIFLEGMADGEVRSDISAEAMATFLLGMLRAGVRDFQTKTNTLQMPELLVEMFLNGVHSASEKKNIVSEMDIAF